MWLGVHVLTGCLMLPYCWARSRFGKMTARYDADIVNSTLFWHFLLATAVMVFALLAVFPLLTGGGS